MDQLRSYVVDAGRRVRTRTVIAGYEVGPLGFESRTYGL
jgi:hypothetical protein